MNCEGFKERLWAFFESKLDAASLADFEGHRDSCQDCTELLRVAGELTCRDFVASLDDYVEGRLTAEARAVFDRHLSLCPDCVTFLESYRQTMKLTRAAIDAPDSPAADALPEHLIRAILAARRGEEEA